jgi:hypothetical protein
MSFGQTQTKELQKLKAAHARYLETYKLLTGTLVGATPFSEFYIYRTFITKYNDPRACAPVGYR